MQRIEVRPDYVEHTVKPKKEDLSRSVLEAVLDRFIRAIKYSSIPEKAQPRIKG